MPLTFTAIPTKDARDAQSGKPDANGQLPEHAISDGNGNPCRHCLKDIPKDAPMLILAYRPFPSAQPYAEVGPIFLCATLCKRHSDSQALPDMLKNNAELLLRGYDAQNRIVYGTGKVTKIDQIEDRLNTGFDNPKISYYHLRSASNNCFQAKVIRTG